MEVACQSNATLRMPACFLTGMHPHAADHLMANTLQDRQAVCCRSQGAGIPLQASSRTSNTSLAQEPQKVAKHLLCQVACAQTCPCRDLTADCCWKFACLLWRGAELHTTSSGSSGLRYKLSFPLPWLTCTMHLDDSSDAEAGPRYT